MQQLQHDLNSSNKEIKMKTEYIEKLEKLYTDAVEQTKFVNKQIEENTKERLKDREEREMDRKHREQRDQELNTKMELMLNSIAQLKIDKDENKTTGTKKTTLDPLKNKASNLRKKKSDKKK